ncbi:hypothetical protein E2C01_031575 [Portunus trituberculatus]|uniref:Uncharacterized protein n=1 Tax=Portunus trituberculatus TaxID=210409 RepID=A0A5B7F0F9_PORTR|nr:hypothetical protein [Portunus trituberculatus]
MLMRQESVHRGDAMARTRAHFTDMKMINTRVVHWNKWAPVTGKKSMMVAPTVLGVRVEVIRVMYTPSRVLKYLMKQDKFFLHNLGRHYGVSIEVGTPQRKIQIEGPKGNVRTCYSCESAAC